MSNLELGPTATEYRESETWEYDEQYEPASYWDNLKDSRVWIYVRETMGLSDQTFAMFNLWLVWLFVGTVFYAYELDIGWAKGFYMAVNIGYSIGWGDISEAGEYGSQWFSTVFVLCGASFIAAALGFFAQAIVDDRDNWYTNELQRIKYEAKMRKAVRNDDNTRMFTLWAKYNREKLRSIVLWLVFVIIATGAALGTHKEWEFIEGLYFAVSSLSTGGHYSLPSDADEWEYGLTGIYCALGVPLMGIAMATLASIFIDTGSIDDLMEKVKERVSEKEIDMLMEFALADDDGTIDKSEFIILCIVRTGMATPDLIKLVLDYFNELDTDKSGTLERDEICERDPVLKQVGIRRIDLGNISPTSNAGPDIEQPPPKINKVAELLAKYEDDDDDEWSDISDDDMSIWQHLTEHQYWVLLREKTGTSDATLLFLVLWLTWLFVGTVFYAYELDIGWAKGFYMAVNIGYSIGWGDISEAGEYGSQWFSTVYVLCGASFIAAALGFFAQAIVDDRDNWYTNELQKNKFERRMAKARRNKSYFRMAKIWMGYNHEKVRSIFLWMLFIIIATGAVLNEHKDWQFIEGLYFAVSSLSTGGHYSLPADTNEWEYGLAGIFAALGVPLMGIAMATLADFFMSTESIEDLMDRIRDKVTPEEIQLLTDFGLADDDGVIDKSEFLILCMVRIGAANPNLVKQIIAHFESLDTSGDGALSMEEICEVEVAKKQAVRRGSNLSSTGVALNDIETGISDFGIKPAPKHNVKHEEILAVKNLASEVDTTVKPDKNALRDEAAVTSAPPPEVPTKQSPIVESKPQETPQLGTDKKFVPLAVSSLLRPRHMTPTRVPYKFDFSNSEDEDEDDEIEVNNTVATDVAAKRITFEEVKNAEAEDLEVTAEERVHKEAMANLAEAWQVLNDPRYVAKDKKEELEELLEVLGVYSADDLADAGVELLAKQLLPMLKPVPQNKIMRLFGLNDMEI